MFPDEEGAIDGKRGVNLPAAFLPSIPEAEIAGRPRAHAPTPARLPGAVSQISSSLGGGAVRANGGGQLQLMNQSVGRRATLLQDSRPKRLGSSDEREMQSRREG